MVADSKKVQTMVNVAAEQIQIVREGLAIIQTVRDAFNAHSPEVAGTPLEGNLSALNTAIGDLDTCVNGGTNGPVWDDLIASRVPSHRGEALQ